jgi:hypothetical protein
VTIRAPYANRLLGYMNILEPQITASRLILITPYWTALAHHRGFLLPPADRKRVVGSTEEGRLIARVFVTY